MIFNSIEFAIFFPLVFALYWLFFQKNTTYRNAFLIAVSYFFYGYWDWRFLSLIIFSSAVDFYIGKKLGTTGEVKKRKSLLLISLVLNLGLLGFFKYYNFFVDSFVSSFTFLGFPLEMSTLQIILPVGISFYTFQTLSYTIDVYKKEMEPVQNPFSFFAFVSFFPQLVAGPIERAKHLLPQFDEPKSLDYEKLRKGILLITSGLFKKIVIADRLAIYINSAFKNVDSIDGFPAILAAFFFALQLYFDFSAYSEIAIGSAKMLDFNLSVNFKRPYLASSFSDFWKRWHISLSSWFKDYVYIPLGGNKGGKWFIWRNLFIVFLLSGLWHGASWNFIIWGALNAIFLIFFDLFLNKIKPNKISRVLISFFVLSCWALSLIFFRAPSFSDAITMYSNLGFSNFETVFSYGFNQAEFYFTLILIVLMFGVELIQENVDELYLKFVQKPAALRWTFYSLVLFTLLFFGSYGSGLGDNAFIYFQF